MKFNYKLTLVYFILFYCFLLTIPLLVSWALPSGIGGAWKQILWLFFVIYSFKYFNSKEFKIVRIVILLFLIFSFFFSILNGINLYRFFYSFWMYIMPIPFYIILVRLDIGRFDFLPKYIFLIYFFFYFFLLIDGVFNIDNLLSFNRVISAQERNVSAYFRAQSFFEGANGFIFFFLSGIIISNQYLKSPLLKYIYFLFIFAASFLTGTRLLIIFTLILIFFFSIRKFYFSLPLVAFFVYLISISFNLIDSGIVSNIGIVDRVLTESDESKRFNQYAMGVSNFKNVFSFQFYFGNGVGSSNDNGAVIGDKVLPHFESSILSLFSELGFFLWLTPIFFNLLFLQKLKNCTKNYNVYLLMFFMIAVGTLTPTMFHYTSSIALILSYLFFKSPLN
jgi:hypothetical protein